MGDDTDPQTPPRAEASEKPVVDQKLQSPGDIAQRIDEIGAAIAQLQATVAASAASRGKVAAFFSSGVFFMLVGAVTLLLAYLTMGPASAIFSFILVVIGVAILLFGTGTQSMGEFNSDASAAKYKVSLAGGAGVLAFCIAIGIVEYYDKMKEAFQIERRYLIVQVEPKSDGYSKFQDFAVDFSINGTPLPVMRRGDFIIAYVPYLQTERGATRTVVYDFHAFKGAISNAKLAADVHGSFPLELGATETNDAGYDFPVSRTHPNIDMSAPSSSQSLIDKTGTDTAPAGTEKSLPPPALPPAGAV